MQKIFIVLLLGCAMLTCAADAVIKNGALAWSDRKYVVAAMPESLDLTAPVPVQKCSDYAITLPAGTKKALIAICDGNGAKQVAKQYNLKPWGGDFYIGTSAKPKLLKYVLFVIENPPEKINCRATSAGGILLALNDNVPPAQVNTAAALAEKKQSTSSAAPENFNGLHKFSAQEYRFEPGPREVQVYVRAPKKGINSNTGLMLVSHNWGGTWKYTAPWCDILSDRFNLICMSVNYLQSGQAKHDKVPYDHGLLQAMDCLRALYMVQKKLDDAKITFNRKRIYAAGASGGGNVSLMVNKLAPATFACIVDLCGMPGLTNDIAFGVGRLNAGYSRDQNSPKYLTKAMQEIRDPGYLPHLAIQKKVNPRNKVVIVHGLDDTHCNPADKMLIASNMVRAKFRPDTYFLTPAFVDGKIIKNTSHAIGNRPEVIARFGGCYLSENGSFAAQITGKSDLDARHDVVYPVTGGKYIISFKAEPTVSFEKSK